MGKLLAYRMKTSVSEKYQQCKSLFIFILFDGRKQCLNENKGLRKLVVLAIRSCDDESKMVLKAARAKG